MNHQIEDDVDIEAPFGERAQTMDLDETRIAQDRTSRDHGRIEPLGLADGENRARLRGRLNHVVRFGQTARHGLFDQHVHAGSEKRQRDLTMQVGRNRERHGVNVSQEVPEVREGTRPARSRHVVGTRGVGVDDGREPSARQRGQNPRVMAAEIPHADHSDPDAHKSVWFSSCFRVFVAMLLTGIAADDADARLIR